MAAIVVRSPGLARFDRRSRNLEAAGEACAWNCVSPDLPAREKEKAADREKFSRHGTGANSASVRRRNERTHRGEGHGGARVASGGRSDASGAPVGGGGLIGWDTALAAKGTVPHIRVMAAETGENAGRRVSIFRSGERSCGGCAEGDIAGWLARIEFGVRNFELRAAGDDCGHGQRSAARS